MTPYTQALALYQGDTWRFTDDLEQHFLFGYVVATPEAFAMARPVRSDWTADKIRTPFEAEPLETADCWFIWVLAGKLDVAMRWLPCELPLLGFARRGKPAKFVEWSRFKAKAS